MHAFYTVCGGRGEKAKENKKKKKYKIETKIYREHTNPEDKDRQKIFF